MGCVLSVVVGSTPYGQHNKIHIGRPRCNEEQTLRLPMECCVPNPSHEIPEKFRVLAPDLPSKIIKKRVAHDQDLEDTHGMRAYRK